MSETVQKSVWRASDCGVLFAGKNVLCDGVHGRGWYEFHIVSDCEIPRENCTILCGWDYFGHWASAYMWNCAQVGSFCSFYVPLSLKWLSIHLHTVYIQYSRSHVKCVYLHSVNLELNKERFVTFLCNFVYDPNSARSSSIVLPMWSPVCLLGVMYCSYKSSVDKERYSTTHHNHNNIVAINSTEG